MIEFIAQQIVERMNDSGHVKCPLRLLYNKRHDLLCCTKQGPHAKATEFWTLLLAIACEDSMNYVRALRPPP